MDIRHAALNQFCGDEVVATLGNLNRPKLACPFVNVLKQMSMDGLQVLQAEVASWDDFEPSLENQQTLMLVKTGSILDPKPMTEDTRARVEVRILVTHSMAAGRPL